MRISDWSSDVCSSDLMEGYKVVTLDDAVAHADIIVTATGNYHVITRDHMDRMKDQAIICNIGHFDNEIDVASIEDLQWEEIKPQVDHVIFPDEIGRASCRERGCQYV